MFDLDKEKIVGKNIVINCDTTEKALAVAKLAKEINGDNPLDSSVGFASISGELILCGHIKKDRYLNLGFKVVEIEEVEFTYLQRLDKLITTELFNKVMGCKFKSDGISLDKYEGKAPHVVWDKEKDEVSIDQFCIRCINKYDLGALDLNDKEFKSKTLIETILKATKWATENL